MKNLLKPATSADIRRLEGNIKRLEGKTMKLESGIIGLRDNVENLGLTVNKLSTTTEEIYKMLDDETRFIKVMEVEHPLVVKRLERVEDKLGLPHTLLESK